MAHLSHEPLHADNPNTFRPTSYFRLACDRKVRRVKQATVIFFALLSSIHVQYSRSTARPYTGSNVSLRPFHHPYPIAGNKQPHGPEQSERAREDNHKKPRFCQNAPWPTTLLLRPPHRKCRVIDRSAKPNKLARKKMSPDYHNHRRSNQPARQTRASHDRRVGTTDDLERREALRDRRQRGTKTR